MTDVPHRPLSAGFLWIRLRYISRPGNCRVAMGVEILGRKEQGLPERHLDPENPDLQLYLVLLLRTLEQITVSLSVLILEIIVFVLSSLHY